MFETRGRSNITGYVGDKYYIVKNPVRLNNSIAVLLPKDWLDAVAMGRDIKHFLIDASNDTFLTIKPHFEDLTADSLSARD